MMNIQSALTSRFDSRLTEQVSAPVDDTRCPVNRFQTERDARILGILEGFFSNASAVRAEVEEGTDNSPVKSATIIDLVQDLSPDARTRVIWSLNQRLNELHLPTLQNSQSRNKKSSEITRQREIKRQADLEVGDFLHKLIDCIYIDRSVDLMRQNNDSEKADRLVIARKLCADFFRDNDPHTFSVEESQLISEYFYYTFLAWRGRLFVDQKEFLLNQGGKMVADFSKGAESLWDNCLCKIPLYPEKNEKAVAYHIPNHTPQNMANSMTIHSYLEKNCKELIQDALKLSTHVFQYLSRTQDATNEDCNTFIVNKLPKYFTNNEDSISHQIFAQSSSIEDFIKRYGEFVQSREKECLAEQLALIAEEDKKQASKQQSNLLRKSSKANASKISAPVAKSSQDVRNERENLSSKVDRSPPMKINPDTRGGNWTNVPYRERTQVAFTQDQLVSKILNQTWNISLTPHITRWIESKRDENIIRAFVDKSGVSCKYAKMTPQEIELQWRYHCIPGLHLILSDPFIKQYAFDYTKCNDAHRYTLWGQLTIPGKQPVKSIITFSIGGNRLFHSFFHPPYEAKNFVQNNRSAVDSRSHRTSQAKVVHHTGDITISQIAQEGFEYPVIVLTSDQFDHSYSIFPKVPIRDSSKSFSRSLF
ncbi:MAG TPA: hypothetical protein VLE96_03485 [Chlamydiales bacterium]|nr:hypothetical protein [Chlamydiales bacterium]